MSLLRCRALLRALSIALALSLSGACGSLTQSSEPPLREYWIVPDASPAVPQTLPIADAILLQMTAPPGLDRPELLQLAASGLLREYAGARWTDRATGVLSLYLNLALEQAQRAAFTAGSPGRRGRLPLQIDLREFFVFSQAGRDTARLSARVSYACSGREFGELLSASAALGEARLAAVVAAHRANLADFSAQLIRSLTRDCRGED